jgi:hypothetical protein
MLAPRIAASVAVLISTPMFPVLGVRVMSMRALP